MTNKSVYARQTASALRLIKAKGALVKWRKTDSAAPADPNQPWNTGAAVNTDYSVSIAFFPPSNALQFIAQIKDTEIPEGTEIGYMGAVNFVPSEKDTVIRGSEVLEIAPNGIKKLAPNGETILYTIVFKK